MIKNKTIITLNDGSHWQVVKVFDTWKVKDKLYMAMQKGFSNCTRYNYTLRGQHSEILMSDNKLRQAMAPK